MLTRDARGAAVLGGVRLGDLFDVAAGGEAVRTPAYVYDVDAMVAAARELGRGFGPQSHLIAYAVKANSAGVILRALAEAGCGADVVSGGELGLALACGISPDRILYSGVAKQDPEIDRAIGAGERGILALEIESVEEIARVEARAAALGRIARVSLRIKPGIVADTHAHIATGHDEAKFGIAQADVPAAFAALAAAPHVRLVGVGSHIGSQLMRATEYLAAADVLIELARERETTHAPLELVDFGGGFGIDYGDGSPTPPGEFAEGISARIARAGLGARTAVVEPGRALVGAHGVLCATVVMTKRSGDRRWLFIDAGMNDLLRPALYGARHHIEPLDQVPPAPGAGRPWAVAGPVCESSDDFGEHAFDDPPPARVLIRDAGAYGYTMASEYNGRPLPAEIFLRGGRMVAVTKSRGIAAWIADRSG